jgi:hypothetical protein
MNGGKKFTSKYSTSIINPAYDNSFKNMFCSDKKILKSLLNSVLFPESKLIDKIKYSKIYFSGKGKINARYGAGSKSIDVGCKCFLKEENDLNIKDNVLMVDVEMQIGFFDIIEERFVDYANEIRVNSNYCDTWVVSFILKENLDDNYTIQLKKKDSDGEITVKDYQSIKLIEISLNHCYSKIAENKDIIINGDEKLSVHGKEWLKFLSCPIWCKADKNNKFSYLFPKHTKRNFFSCSLIKKAIEKILSSDSTFDLSEVDEYYNNRERKDYINKCEENKNLKSENKNLKSENKGLISENKGLKSENKVLKTENKDLKTGYEGLKSENKDLKKQLEFYKEKEKNEIKEANIGQEDDDESKLRGDMNEDEDEDDDDDESELRGDKDDDDDDDDDDNDNDQEDEKMDLD